MNIYFYGCAEKYAYLSSHFGVDDDPCEPDPPRSLMAEWKPPTLELVGSDTFNKFMPKGDFFHYLPSTVFLSARAADRLRPILERSGEILPVHLNNDRDMIYLFNVTCVVNAVDMKRSRFLQLPSGAIGPCEHLVFNPKLIPKGTSFFKNTQMGPATSIFLTERAVEAVIEAKLIGHDFYLAWSDRLNSK